MFGFIEGLTFLEKFLLTCAMSGSVVFFIRMILLFAGIAGQHGDAEIDTDVGDHHEIEFDSSGHEIAEIHTDADVSVDIDTDFDDVAADVDDVSTDHSGDIDHHDSDASFKFVSIQGLTAFMMMFGWVGLSLIRDLQLPGWAAIAGGVLSGVLTVWILSYFFRFAIKLQSDGTMRISSAILSKGNVYLRIPKDGTGQVQVEVDGRLKVFDAKSSTNEEIKTGEKITVVMVQNDGVLVVEKDDQD